jgi:hypothetical protein
MGAAFWMKNEKRIHKAQVHASGLSFGNYSHSCNFMSNQKRLKANHLHKAMAGLLRGQLFFNDELTV